MVLLHISSRRTTVIMTVILLSLWAGVPCLSSPNSNVTYDDIVQLNGTCHSLDSCQGNNRSTDDLRFVNCQCGPQCVIFGTCCVDSVYRESPHSGGGTGGFKCRRPLGMSSNQSVFMVEGCRVDSDDFTREQCFGDGQALDDLMLLIPVTSSRTGYTYRNYFCFACNEDPTTDSAIHWHLNFTSASPNITNYSMSDLHFDEARRAWAFRGTDVNFRISVATPDAAGQHLVYCREPVVDTCPEYWTSHLDTREKCGSYMALIYDQSRFSQKLYRNPHCAACNFAYTLSCTQSRAEEETLEKGPLFVNVFSLQDKAKRCPSRMLYDKLSKKCRVVRCGRRKKFERGMCRYSYS